MNASVTGATAAVSASGSALVNGAYAGGVRSNLPALSSGGHIFIRFGATGSTSANGDSLSDAIANNAYVSFTVTNNGTNSLKLTNLSFTLFDGRDVVGGASMTAMHQSAGFTLGNELSGSTVTAGPILVPQSNSRMSSSSLSVELAAGASEEFRLYTYDGDFDPDHLYRFDNISVTAEAIPEPSSAALLGLGGLALILRRRK